MLDQLQIMRADRCQRMGMGHPMVVIPMAIQRSASESVLDIPTIVVFMDVLTTVAVSTVAASMGAASTVAATNRFCSCRVGAAASAAALPFLGGELLPRVIYT